MRSPQVRPQMTLPSPVQPWILRVLNSRHEKHVKSVHVVASHVGTFCVYVGGCGGGVLHKTRTHRHGATSYVQTPAFVLRQCYVASAAKIVHDAAPLDSRVFWGRNCRKQLVEMALIHQKDFRLTDSLQVSLAAIGMPFPTLQISRKIRIGFALILEVGIKHQG